MAETEECDLHLVTFHHLTLFVLAWDNLIINGYTVVVPTGA